ncbi:MAG: STAS domain-containing protein [Rhodococcus sp. (in: high G+C Gram-positive bacteria)]
MIIRTDIEPTQRVVHLVGRFDAHETGGFRTAVSALLTEEHNELRLDLSQVAFVDSSALAELVRLQKAASALGGELILSQLSDPVRVILEITELAGIFIIEGTETRAP